MASISATDTNCPCGRGSPRQIGQSRSQALVISNRKKPPSGGGRRTRRNRPGSPGVEAVCRRRGKKGRSGIFLQARQPAVTAGHAGRKHTVDGAKLFKLDPLVVFH